MKLKIYEIDYIIMIDIINPIISKKQCKSLIYEIKI